MSNKEVQVIVAGHLWCIHTPHIRYKFFSRPHIEGLTVI